jgi:signal transduction histidine kinase
LDIIVPKQNDMTLLHKILILFLFFFSFYFKVDAQAISKKDSLMAIIKKSKQDTSMVWALLDYGRIMSNEHADSATFYYKKAYTLGKKLNHKKGMAQYYHAMIFLQDSRFSNYQEALRLSREFELFAISEKNDKFQSGAYFSLASTYQNLNQLDSAIYYYENTLKLIDNTKFSTKIASIYGRLSGIYSDQKMNEISLEYLDKAIEMNVNLQDTSALIVNYINKSTLYYQMKNIVGEERCNREGLRLATLTKNPYLQIAICTNTGAMFEDRKQYDSSLYYNKKAYKLAKEYGSPVKSINPLIGIVACYAKKKDFNEANKYLQIIAQNPDIKRITLEQQLLITEQKINVFKGIGKYKEASKLFLDYNKLRDSTTNIATQERVLEFNNKLKKAESEKVILSKEVEINKQKTWLYLLSISGIALLLLGFLYYRYQNKKQEAKSQQIKLLEQENEFVAVKSSLEGQLNERVRISKEIHDDLGSSLTTISLLTEVLKTKIDGVKVPEVAKISATSARMVDSMNEIVWALNVHNDTLDSLVAFIRKYARDFLQDTSIKLVFEEDVNQDFTLQGNVRRSIYLVVKEAINNVVKHADAQQVNLNIQTDNNKLTIMIEDDGKGINEEKKSAFGNGLRNMKQRIEDIGGTFDMYQTKGMVVSIEYNFI